MIAGYQKTAKYFFKKTNFMLENALARKILVLGKIFFFFILLVSLAQPLHASNQSSEYKIKAGYLYNFTKFIDWPDEPEASPDQTFTICLLGNDPFGDVLTPINNKKTKGQQIELVRFTRMSQEVSNCKILFISRSEQKHIKQILRDLSGLSILAVGDMENFAEAGGVVGFVIRDGRVRLTINHTAAQQANLNISAKLLEIAHVLEVQR